MRFRFNLYLTVALSYFAFFQSLALAQPAYSGNSSKPQLSNESAFVLDNLSEVTKQIQRSLKNFYLEESSNLKATDSEIKAKNKNLQDLLISQDQILENNNSRLKQATQESFKAHTKLLIIPDLVATSAQLVNMGHYFREQSGLSTGSETLSAGPNSEYFQHRRDALAMMIADLKKDVEATSQLMSDRRKVLQKVRDNLTAVSQGKTVSQLELGFDYFINLQLGLLESQFDVLSDFARMNSGYNLDNYPEPSLLVCASDQSRFKNLNEHARLINDYTRTWVGELSGQADYRVSEWRSNRTSDNIKANASPKDVDGLFNGFTNSKGIYQPGIIESWDSCIYTKINILKDLQSKIAVEVSRGNIATAREMGLIENKLITEIEFLKGQRLRLSQISQRLAKLAGIAQENSFLQPGSARLTSPDWKTAVYSQSKNLERLNIAHKSILLAARKLQELAISTVAKTDHNLTKDRYLAVLEPIALQLTAIDEEGFGLLEQELLSYKSSLETMSMNIASAEGWDGEGGLQEAISVFERVVSLKNQQMIKDANENFPRQKQAADALVTGIGQERLASLAVRKVLEQKFTSLDSTEKSYTELNNSFKSFFAPKYSHPLIVRLTNQFLRELKLSRKTNGEVSKIHLSELSKTLTIASTSSFSKKSEYCSGRKKPSCEAVKNSVFGRKVTKKKNSLLKKIPALVEVNVAANLSSYSFNQFRQQLQSLRILIGSL